MPPTESEMHRKARITSTAIKAQVITVSSNSRFRTYERDAAPIEFCKASQDFAARASHKRPGKQIQPRDFSCC